jgi:DNA repair exonuclease SbcCD ATPase subunit
MKSEPATFLWVEIEGFRGFRDAQRLELDASVVILTGPNGTGKTSVFDALQWLLLGSLERLEPFRARKNTEHIANAFRGEEPAVVTAGLRFGDGEAEVERRGRHESGVLEWRDKDGVVRGEQAERRLARALLPDEDDPAQLGRLLMTSALLQQDVVRGVLEDKPGERYQHLASLLGVSDVNQFEVAARRRADRVADAARQVRTEFARIEDQHRSARERLDLRRTQQSSAPDTTRARDEMTERLRRHQDVLRLAGELPTAAADALLLQTSLRDVGDELAMILEANRGIATRMEAMAPVEPSEAKSAADDVSEAEAAQKAAQAKHQHSEAEFAAATARSEALASLATAALPLLGDHCPVCQQEIVQSDVESHLRELIEQGGAELPRLNEQRQAARAAVEQAETRTREVSGRLASIRERDEVIKQLGSEREVLRSRLLAAVDRAHEAGIELLLAPQLAKFDDPAFTTTIEGLRTVWRATGDLAILLRALPAGDEIAAAEGEVRRLDALLVEAREQLVAASTREEEARTLQRAATRAAAGVADSRFRELAPLIRDIFSRLDPHPVFKDLDFALGVYRERGEARPVVRDVDETVEAEPLIVFSSSQANVAALSYFLALGWAAGADAMPFVLLDDPLQSLDDVNALGFADLCRHIRQQRQLIVSTHDRRLAALLERKLAPRGPGEITRLIEFTSWTKRGPQLEFRVIEPQLKEGSDRHLVAEAA